MAGASPVALFGITVDSTNLANIMRAIMGLYFGMIVIWLWGAFSLPMAGPALVSCAVFMLGLAAGRTLSFALDGMPHWLLVVYTVIEVVLGTIAIVLYRIHISTGAERCVPVEHPQSAHVDRLGNPPAQL